MCLVHVFRFLLYHHLFYKYSLFWKRIWRKNASWSSLECSDFSTTFLIVHNVLCFNEPPHVGNTAWYVIKCFCVLHTNNYILFLRNFEILIGMLKPQQKWCGFLLDLKKFSKNWGGDANSWWWGISSLITFTTYLDLTWKQEPWRDLRNWKLVVK